MTSQKVNFQDDVSASNKDTKGEYFPSPISYVVGQIGIF